MLRIRKSSVRTRKLALVKATQYVLPIRPLPPTTLSQTQCSAMHKRVSFSHVNQCEKTTALDREHFCVFVRIRRHWRKLAQPHLKANLSRSQKNQEPAQGGLRSKPWRLAAPTTAARLTPKVPTLDKIEADSLRGPALHVSVQIEAALARKP